MKIQYQKIILLVVIWFFTALSAHALTMNDAIQELEGFGVFKETTSDLSKKAAATAYIYNRSKNKSPQEASTFGKITSGNIIINNIPPGDIPNGKHDIMTLGGLEFIFFNGEWQLYTKDSDGNDIARKIDTTSANGILTKSQYDNEVHQKQTDPLPPPENKSNTAGLVNCGSDGQEVCTICHLIEGIHGIVKYITGLMVIVAITVITVAGIMYIISAGGGMVAIAKKAVLNTLVGITIVLVTFMSITFILNSVFEADKKTPMGAGGLTLGAVWNFSCDKTPSLISKGGGSATSGGGGTGGAASEYPATTQSEKEARDALKQKSGGNITVSETSPGATNISNLRQESLDGTIAFQKEVGAPITVTGGAESGGPHKAGEKSHANGYKVDIDDTAAVNNYIEKSYTSVPVSKTGRSDISAAYTDGKGNMYYKENTHWDVCYQCGKVPS